MSLGYPFEHPGYAPAARIAETLRHAENILVTAHVNPDGDAVGSMLALAHGLAGLGKRVALCNASGIPDYLSWLPVPGPVYARLSEVPFAPGLAVVLDCADAARLGKCLEKPISALPTINIDHHPGNPMFGSVDNWVDPEMAATGQMAAAALAALGVPLRGEVAETVYVALVTDTGGFAFDNTSPQVFELAAHLVRQGLNVAAVRRGMDNQLTLSRMRLWGRLLQDFSLHNGGRTVLVKVPLAVMAACGAVKEEMEGLAEHLRRLRGVEVVALVREDCPGRCRLSLRSFGPVDVRAMAAVFGGGGHCNAAGATLEMPLDESGRAVLDVVRRSLGAQD